MFPLLPLFSGEMSQEEQISIQEEAPTRVEMPGFDDQNTLNGLGGTSIVCPPANTELLTPTSHTAFATASWMFLELKVLDKVDGFDKSHGQALLDSYMPD